ncbi:drug/metabolite transporter (DMT)-like permease [Nocardioides sp. BE266]|uniref:EamA family transporter n=1 Tax=Nocardioides sp. BE266 TaxID=2817725 RepID=UPI00285B013B|nr:EamA family transporter [Nocardioides sp. BE266]MDR7254256.1 drug/metabolite transporter (DMT)-like permease [Nocardioides sp. BE266]
MWVLWGSVYLAIRLVVEEVDPFQAMAQRFLLAGTILSIVVLVRRGWRGLKVTRLQLVGLVVTGVLLLGLGNGFQALAQVEGLPSGVAALIVASVPAWAVILRACTGDRPSSATVVGVAVGFSGLVLLVALGRGMGGALPVVGVVLCLGSSIAWTIGAWLQGRLSLPDDIFAIAAYQQLIAALCSASLAVASGEHLSTDYTARGWFGLAYLVVACSIVGFLAFAWLLTHVPLSLTATHAYVNPVVAVLLGWLVLGEPITVAVSVGGAVVVAAVVVIVTAENRATSSPTAVDDAVAEHPV